MQTCDLPLTGSKVVDRIITDLAIFDVEADGLVLRRLAPGIDEATVRERTGSSFRSDLDVGPEPQGT